MRRRGWAYLRRRFDSLATRSTLVTLCVLVLTLGLAGLVLNHAYYEAAKLQLESRLQGYAYALLEGTEYTEDGQVIGPETTPVTYFSRPHSGLYAVMVGGNGFYWKSRSAVGYYIPSAALLSSGQDHFAGPVSSSVGGLYIYALSTHIQNKHGDSTLINIRVAESAAHFAAQTSSYKRTLFIWLLAVGLVVLVLQWLLLRWTLAPLRRVSRELANVEKGDQDKLVGRYPYELSRLTRGINMFVSNEREHMLRYRHTLADLAHSLKTPLAVMRSKLESMEAQGKEDMRQLLNQTSRMDDMLAYQLARAATHGKPTFAKPVAVLPVATDIVESLEKVYAVRHIECEFDIDEGRTYEFYGDKGDLTELMGNLLENAFKWADSRIILRLQQDDHAQGNLRLVIEDDGKGIDPAQVSRVFKRGARADEKVAGHGLGLAIVNDLVQSYHAELEVSNSRELGGACFCLRFTKPQTDMET